MKLNWGTGIAIFYTAFVLIMITMVVSSFQNKAQLVQENYYQLDLDYEAFRQKRQNGANMDGAIKFDVIQNEKAVQITFPTTMQSAVGSIKLFRPSNKFMDEDFPIALDDQGQMTLHLRTPKPDGRWIITLDWEANNIAYFKEENIVF